MAHKKGAGSSRNGRESHSKRLGVKIYGGQLAIAGNIIIRQRGTTHHPGEGVGMGRDHTIFALQDGIVYFRKKRQNRSYVSVLSPEAYNSLTGQNLAIVEIGGDQEPELEKTEAKESIASKETTKPEKKAEEKTSKPQQKDNLKLIEGLGPAFEKKLNAAGITSFAQLAALSADDLVNLEANAGIKAAKVEKDKWIEQAAALIKK